jgi:hypothetical protein
MATTRCVGYRLRPQARGVNSKLTCEDQMEEHIISDGSDYKEKFSRQGVKRLYNSMRLTWTKTEMKAMMTTKLVYGGMLGKQR